jgi:hypothetical protein
LRAPPAQRQQKVAQGVVHAARFNADAAIAAYLKIYQRVLATSTVDGILK